MLPTAPRAGYATAPDVMTLARMSLEQLRAVPKFTVRNEHGSIEFLPPPGRSGLDLSQVNLGRDIIINKRSVEVYEKKYMAPGEHKPALHSKLNVPSIISLFRVQPRNGKTPAEQEKILQDIIKRQNEAYVNDGETERAEHISYDHNTFEWVFKVPHFTQWGDDEDGEEDQSMTANIAFEPASLKKQTQPQFAFKNQGPVP